MASAYVKTYGSAAAFVFSVLLVISDAHAQTLTVEPEFVPGEVIVKLKGNSKTMKSQAFIGKAVSEQSMSLKGSWSGLNMHHFKLTNAADLQAKIAELQKDPDVEYAEPNYIVRLSPTKTGSMGGISMDQARLQLLPQTLAPLQLTYAWQAETAGKAPPVVAIIDTGVDINHEIFVSTGAIWTNLGEIPGNGIDDDGNGFVDDVHGWNFVSNDGNPLDDDNHGTHVAGIVLGSTQNILAVPLQPAKIRIMPLKFLDGNGMGTTSDAVKAIYYAVNNGARVLNNSWGGGGYSNSLVDAVGYAYSKRSVFVAAAGNSSTNNDVNPIYPANYSVPGLISVAATTDSDALAQYSNYGASSVHLGAPGSQINSTLPGQRYGPSSGTSMATPFVSGIAAMMIRENPDLSAYQVKQLILSGAQPISSLQAKTTSKSRLNAYNAVLAAKSQAGDSTQPQFVGASRLPASEDMGAAGCGLVKALSGDSSNGGSGPANGVALFGLIALFVAPILIALVLRQKNGKSRRRFPRYQISSQVKVSVGGRELTGEVNSISMGGVQVALGEDGPGMSNPDTWLDNGGVVSMVIKSPDGREEIRVAGKVVWSEEKKRYGVAFEGADTSVLNSIGRWTANLLKT